ncbi:MAG TPA: DUF1080 domain-containing protein [Planctomycetota bacterium]|nr:DUF1080 domain-containing protein [Planctomycetota bacterium]
MRKLVWCVVWALCAAAIAGEEAKPTEGLKPPEGAVVLFDGKDASQWDKAKVTPEGYLEAGAITKEKFADCQLHLEFNIQPDPTGKKVSGNSGVYIQNRYEIQILNSAGGNPSKGGCGAIYQFKPADTNQAKPPGEWQTYDITFRAPRWDDQKKKAENARISVVHNGVRIHDNVEVPNKTGHGKPEGPEPGPLCLQDHRNKVCFRNIWLLPLKAETK